MAKVKRATKGIKEKDRWLVKEKDRWFRDNTDSVSKPHKKRKK